MERSGVEIDHQRPQCGAMGIEARHFALIRLGELMEPVDDIDVEVEKRVAPGIAIQRMFEQPLCGLDVNSEGSRRFIGLHRFFEPRDPAEVGGFEGRLEIGSEWLDRPPT